MMRQIVEKVPHVHGKSCELMVELIDEIGFVEDWCGGRSHAPHGISLVFLVWEQGRGGKTGRVQ